VTVKGYGNPRASALPNRSAPSTGSTLIVGTTNPAGRKAMSSGLATRCSTISSAIRQRGTGLAAVHSSHSWMSVSASIAASTSASVMDAIGFV
jgi:hypothetical protein